MSNISKFGVNVRRGMPQNQRRELKAQLRPMLSVDDLVNLLITKVRPNKRFTRAVGNEVFLRQITLPYVAANYLAFLNSRGFQTQLEYNEIAREIASTMCKDKEFYLKDQNFCWIGYLVQPSFALPQGFPRSSGDLINCRHNLLREDPELRQNPNIELMPAQGITARIHGEHLRYDLPEEVFTPFVKR